ncbi:MAG: dTMP kinase [Peptoniphilus sp.]|nr:dTMP kinase [Peptoniphilus sp.]MDY3118112.1 dTMP kinase [Peptoniphilus sp.]
MRGLFVVIEGPDGSGKSTVAEGIVRYFRGKGVSVLHTREPGGTAISERIREMLLDSKNKDMHPRCEALLYAASRAQHVEEVIRPALEEGTLVVSERYVFSSLVYQGLCRKLGIQPVEEINAFATDGLAPDVTLYLDVAKGTGRDRMKDRRADRLESDDKIMDTVEENYRILANERKEEMVLIDASQDAERVLLDCIGAIEKENRFK